VLDHLPEEQKLAVAKQLNAAYALEDHAAAKQALNALHRELMDLNPSAARSLGEGLEETFDCRAGMQKRETLAWWGPAGALGRVGALGCAESVSTGHRPQKDPGARQRIRSLGAVRGKDCQAEKGVVK
jgi:hypothetical protein